MRRLPVALAIVVAVTTLGRRGTTNRLFHKAADSATNEDADLHICSFVAHTSSRFARVIAT